MQRRYPVVFKAFDIHVDQMTIQDCLDNGRCVVCDGSMQKRADWIRVVLSMQRCTEINERQKRIDTVSVQRAITGIAPSLP